MLGVTVFKANRGLTQVVFGCSCEILEAKLVLDGHDQPTSGLEQALDLLEHALCWLAATDKNRSVFQHTDKGDHVKTLLCLEMFKVVGQDGDVVKVSRALSGNARALQTAFQCQHFSTAFTQVTCDGATTRTNFQNAALKVGLKWAQHIGPYTREVVGRYPVAALAGQFAGQARDIAGFFDERQHVGFGLFTVRVRDAGVTWALPNAGVGVLFVGRCEKNGGHGVLERMSMVASKLQRPKKCWSGSTVS